MSRSIILWKQVWALGGLQAAITLTWVIYNLYLPDLLSQFGYTADAIFAVILIETILAIAMEPLMGNFSDRLQRTLTTQFPFIFSGVLLASGLFIVIPIVVFVGPMNGLVQWVLPLIMVAWALAMSCFRSPALSLLGRYAIDTEWAPAASILTMLGSLASSIGVLAKSYLLSLGPAITFVVGSLVLLASAAILRTVSPKQRVDERDRKFASQRALSLPALMLVFGTGVGIAIGFRLALPSFSEILTERISNSAAGVILGGVFLAQAFAALPAGRLARKLGVRRAMVIALAVLVALNITILGVSHGSSTGISILLWGMCFSVVATGSVPFALSSVPAQRAGLGTGMYFGGGAAALSFLATVQHNVSLSTSMSLLFGALAFMMAAFCIQMSDRIAISN